MTKGNHRFTDKLDYSTRSYEQKNRTPPRCTLRCGSSATRTARAGSARRAIVVSMTATTLSRANLPDEMTSRADGDVLSISTKRDSQARCRESKPTILRGDRDLEKLCEETGGRAFSPEIHWLARSSQNREGIALAYIVPTREETATTERAQDWVRSPTSATAEGRTRTATRRYET